MYSCCPDPSKSKPLGPDGRPLLDFLREGEHATQSLLESFPAERLTVPHAPGEWTLLDILQHITDTERVFAYRLLRIARGDRAALPGFDQDEYAAAARANERTLDDLVEEYRSVRHASLVLIAGLSDHVLTSTGTADGNPLSVRAAIYIIAGHERYHLASIKANYG